MASEFLIFPPWAEAFLNTLVKRYIPPEKVAMWLKEGVKLVTTKLKELVDATAPGWDNAILAAVEDALLNCAAGGDSDTICKVLTSGKTELIRIARVLAANTETKLDDTMVDILAAALGVA